MTMEYISIPSKSSQALKSALQLKSPKNVAQQMSPAQLLMSALQSKTTTQPPTSVNALLSALQPKPVKTSTPSSLVNICEPLSPRDSLRKGEESSRALKKLLVISQQHVSASLSTPSKLTYSQSFVSVSSKNDEKTMPASHIISKESGNVSQMEKKCKQSKDKERERPKSRSNSEGDAEFYAGSAILNSPNPEAVPLPDFDESCDFFSVECRYPYNIVENLDGSFSK